MRLAVFLPAALPALVACMGACEASSFATLHVFNWTRGAYPNSGLVADGAGNLYGTTEAGGEGSGYGTVFRLAAGGRFTVLHKFRPRRDGADPLGVALGPDGTLYGTTFAGTTIDKKGTAFAIPPLGKENVLDAFRPATGDLPMAGPFVDSAGNLFGTTDRGGPHNVGLVYEIPAGGAQKVLYEFKGMQGRYSQAGVIEDGDGNLYGTTAFGGDLSCRSGEGCGVVYKLAPGGEETVLHAFHGGSDGQTPLAGVIRDAAGNLYGTTSNGGGTGCGGGFGCGTVFRIAPDGAETILFAFDDTGGRYPVAGLAQDAAGNLYGAASGGGSKSCGDFGCGVIFELAPNGTETVLHAFSGTDGNNPLGTPLLDGAGNLYGTAEYGGGGTAGQCASSGGCGTIFKLTP